MAKPSNDCRVKGHTWVLCVNTFYFLATDGIAGAESCIYSRTCIRLLQFSSEERKTPRPHVHYILLRVVLIPFFSVAPQVNEQTNTNPLPIQPLEEGHH